ncbi:MAG: hypothetical protein Satyrvirus13_9 [Satyrvirus sp.]|uniref:Thioredoxin domain-containing protein n=1 Tax=Satyrvirus sp. TaxID=2487771 RepID=A0A3G5ADT1_9VIRU|nr:MAG: hypothetical protein Satyrvirus13_9 [Satyrvirus sp.]
MNEKLGNREIFLIILGIIIILILIYWLNHQSVQYFKQALVAQPTIKNPKKITTNVQPTKWKSHQPLSSFTLYYFYRITCPHCAKFTPVWDEISNKLISAVPDKITPKAVDVTLPENSNLTFYHDAFTVPTIILVTPTGNIKYTGNRTPDDFYNFVMEHINK